MVFSYLFLYFSIGDKNLDRELLTCLWGIMPSLVESPALHETSCECFVTLDTTTRSRMAKLNLQSTLNKTYLSVVNNIINLQYMLSLILLTAYQDIKFKNNVFSSVIYRKTKNLTHWAPIIHQVFYKYYHISLSQKFIFPLYRWGKSGWKIFIYPWAYSQKTQWDSYSGLFIPGGSLFTRPHRCYKTPYRKIPYVQFTIIAWSSLISQVCKSTGSIIKTVFHS